MILTFKQYLHNEWEEIPTGGGSLGDALKEAGICEDPYDYHDGALQELREKMGRPFYEVALGCTLDTDTGVVTVTHFDGVPLQTPKTV